MNDETRNGQYPPQQYPQSGQYPPQQYPQSGQPYQQYPQSGQPYQQYPQSGQPYQQYPQSGQYPPQYQQPYMQPAGEKKGKVNLWVVLAIVVAVVLLIGAIFYQLVDLKKKADAKAVKNIQNATLMDYSQYKNLENDTLGLIVDGSEVSLPQRMLTINEHSYISVEDFSKYFGYKFEMDAVNKKTKVISKDRTAVFTQDTIDAVITTDNDEWDVTMTDKTYMFDNGQTYVPLRSLAEVFGFKSVDWDDSTNTVVVVTTGK